MIHATPQAEDEVKRRLRLNVVIGEGPAVFQLFSGENQSLLIGRYSFGILNRSFYTFDGDVPVQIQVYRLAGQRLDVYFHRGSTSLNFFFWSEVNNNGEVHVAVQRIDLIQRCIIPLEGMTRREGTCHAPDLILNI